MLHKTVKHIHRFRVYFLAFIIVAFFYELGLNPVDLGKFVGAKVGSAIGMSISVPENPINKLALELKQKEEGLDQRERELNEREKELARSSAWNDNMYLFMGGGIVVLFFLVLMNFYLDMRRRKAEIKK
ncbi:MAG: hypothetical protein V1867_07330 [Candidatus Falkowbacteria bacterium]